MAKLEYQEKDGKVFCPLANKWLVAKPEEKVRQRYICMGKPMMKHLSRSMTTSASHCFRFMILAVRVPSRKFFLWNGVSVFSKKADVWAWFSPKAYSTTKILLQ